MNHGEHGEHGERGGGVAATTKQRDVVRFCGTGGGLTISFANLVAAPAVLAVVQMN
jgi:hypothetical protein